MKVDAWGLATARLVILAARLDGLSLALRPDGSPVVRGGPARPELLDLLARHREAVVAVLARQAGRLVA